MEDRAKSEKQRKAPKSLEVTLQRRGSTGSEDLQLKMLSPSGQSQGTGGNVVGTRYNITAKSNLGRKGFIWLTLPGHNSPLRGVREGTLAGTKGRAIGKSCLTGQPWQPSI